MDKIPISDYLKNYVLTDKTANTGATWFRNEIIELIAPSPQLINWFVSRGWVVVDKVISDPSESTDWATLQKYMMISRRILGSIMDEVTDAYNQGRTINNDRYDEILALWGAVSDKTEDGLTSLESDESTFESLVGAVINNLSAEYTTHNNAITNQLSTWGDAQRERIDDKYDADKAAGQASIISRGFYSSTIVGAFNTGIERERTSADLEVEDRILERQLENKRYLYNQQVDIRMKFLEAKNRLITLLHSQGDARIQIRNKVIDAVAGFAERRTDDYPSFLEPYNAALNVAIDQNSNGWAEQ